MHGTLGGDHLSGIVGRKISRSSDHRDRDLCDRTLGRGQLQDQPADVGGDRACREARLQTRFPAAELRKGRSMAKKPKAGKIGETQTEKKGKKRAAAKLEETVGKARSIPRPPRGGEGEGSEAGRVGKEWVSQ